MKTFMVLLLSMVVVPFAWAQGTATCLRFANVCQFQTPDPTGGNRLVYDVGSPLDPVNGVKLSGTQYVAELYAGLDANNLVPMPSMICRFRSTTASNKGTWSTTTIAGQNNCVSLPLASPGSSVVLQVRVWDSSQFPTYEEALGKGKTGASKPFTYITPPFPPPTDTCLEGLQAFALVSPTRAIQVMSPRLTNGRFGFDVTRLTPGTTNQIQVSSNLRDWATLLTDTASSNAVSFLDTNTNGTTPQRRFYRVKQEP